MNTLTPRSKLASTPRRQQLDTSTVSPVSGRKCLTPMANPPPTPSKTAYLHSSPKPSPDASTWDQTLYSMSEIGILDPSMPVSDADLPLEISARLPPILLFLPRI